MANQWHVPYELLSPEAQDYARAIQSLIEELEAVDWYNQRAHVTHDDALRQTLEHNRDEEKEHASMLLEWIRRRDPKFDQELRAYLFASGNILDAETGSAPGGEGPETSVSGTEASAQPVEPSDGPSILTVGSLRPGK
jgi:uncharacterized protein